MSPTRVNKLLVGSVIVVLVVGIVDAGIGGEWDFFLLLLIALALTTALFIGLESRRPAIPIRRDLVKWLSRRADVSGESLTVIADRAVADYQERYGSTPIEQETT